MRRGRPVAAETATMDADAAGDDERRAPHIDDSQLPKPLTLTLGRPAELSVQVFGQPPPIVQWLVGRRRVKESARCGQHQSLSLRSPAVGGSIKQ